MTGGLTRSFTISAAMLFFMCVSASAAGMGPGTTTQQQMAGPYRIVLIIGKAELMTTHPMKGAEMTVGGKMSSCHMGGGGMSGMQMGGQSCNHHVEVHVY